MIESSERFTGEFVSYRGSSVHLFEQPGPTLSKTLWSDAMTLDAFIAGAEQHRDLWHTTRRLAQVGVEPMAAVAAIDMPLRLVVLLEDWCGDAIHTVPFVQRLVEANPLLELRVLRRDQHDDVMSTHLTGASRAIPVVMVFDGARKERGWWGPRPTPLQAWVQVEGLLLEKADRYRAIRTWYARDRGATTIAEIIKLLEHAAAAA